MKLHSKATYKWKHGALLIKGNKIISRGYNRTLGEKCGLASYHAEKMALMNCEKREIRGATLLVIRLKHNVDYSQVDFQNCDIRDIFMYSKPCCKCESLIQKCIREYGLKRIYFSS